MGDTSTITPGGYYVYVIVSLINAPFFIFVVFAYGYLFKVNKYAMVVLICIVFYSLELFWMLELIVPFSSNCYEDGLCDRCRTARSMRMVVFKIKAVAILLMLIKILEINFQPFPLLAYSKGFIIMLKTFVIMFFMVGSMILSFLIPLKYTVQSVKNDQQKHICYLSNDDITTTQATSIVIVFLCYFTCIVIFGLLFIQRTIKLYSFASTKLIVKDKKKKRNKI